MRYAILFSGMSFRRHVNGLEFCYRTLVDRLGFLPQNIQVLNYDGSLGALGDDEGADIQIWPGDRTPFRMPVTAEGSRHAFQGAVRAVAAQLKPDDQLFINTTGHGGHHGTSSGPDLIAYPHGHRFKRQDFCEDIAALPPIRSLVVLMTQCFSGGFKSAILAISRASATAVVAAADESRPSLMSLHDGNWDSFQRNFLAALGGYEVTGQPLPSGCSEGSTTIHEAFQYAISCPGRNPFDSPEIATRPELFTNITLMETQTQTPPHHPMKRLPSLKDHVARSD